MKKAKEILKKLKLRPTLQRVAITEILLRKKQVHVTAYSLEKLMVKNKIFISRATIYNNLNELLLLYIFHILKEDLAKFKKSS